MPRTKKTVTNREAVESVNPCAELLENSDAMNGAIERARKFEENNQTSVIKSVVPDQVLSNEEVTALTYHENVIEKGLETFIEVGQSLQYIRDNRLYRADYKTFADYCEEKWDFSARQAQRLMSSSKIINLLEENTTQGSQLPESERVARPLAKLKNNPELMAQAWIELTGKTQEEYEQGLRKSDQPTHNEVDEKVKEYEARIKELENNQKSLFNELNEAKTKIDNQNKDIQEKHSKLSQLEVKERELNKKEEQLNKKEEQLNKHIEVKAEEKVTEKTEEELKKLNQQKAELEKQKAELEKDKAQINKDLKDAENLKRTAQRQKDNLNSTQEWITNFQLTNTYLVEATHELKKYKNKLQKNPDLSELEEKDRAIVEEKIKNLIVDFNDNLHSLGGAINYLNGAVVKFNNHALRVIDAEVTDNE